MKNIHEMSYDELVAFRNEINKEIDRQYNKRREADWLIVVDAIKKYCVKYGSIDVTDPDGETCYFDDTWDFSEIGEIK